MFENKLSIELDIFFFHALRVKFLKYPMRFCAKIVNKKLHYCLCTVMKISCCTESGVQVNLFLNIKD